MGDVTLTSAVTHWAIVGNGTRSCSRAMHSRKRLVLHNYHCECGRYDTQFRFWRRRALACWINEHVMPRWRDQAVKSGRPRRKPR